MLPIFIIIILLFVKYEVSVQKKYCFHVTVYSFYLGASEK